MAFCAISFLGSFRSVFPPLFPPHRSLLWMLIPILPDYPPRVLPGSIDRKLQRPHWPYRRLRPKVRSVRRACRWLLRISWQFAWLPLHIGYLDRIFCRLLVYFRYRRSYPQWPVCLRPYRFGLPRRGPPYAKSPGVSFPPYSVESTKQFLDNLLSSRERPTSKSWRTGARFPLEYRVRLSESDVFLANSGLPLSFQLRSYPLFELYGRSRYSFWPIEWHP